MCRYIYISILLGVNLFFYSCQKDNFTTPEVTPKEYTFQIPGEIAFHFSQIAASSQEPIPYQNALVIENLGTAIVNSSYSILAFKDDTFAYNNLLFQNNGAFSELNSNASSDTITLPETNVLFSNMNTLVSLLNYNDQSHEFSGRYEGEINIYREGDTALVFEQSFISSGIIDFQGRLYLFTQDATEENIVFISGNFNDENLITGEIINAQSGVYASLENGGEDLMNTETDTTIQRQFFYNIDGDPKRILEFKLTKQN